MSNQVLIRITPIEIPQHQPNLARWRCFADDLVTQKEDPATTEAHCFGTLAPSKVAMAS